MRPIPFIMDVKKEMGDKPLIGVEIGVYRAEHAELMLQHLNLWRLYLIDPYVDNDPDFRGHMKPSVPAAKAIAHERLKQYDQVVWIEKKSNEVEFNETLDFVYIDGNHSYKYVMRDVIYYELFVRRNGWVGGHDYVMRRSPLIEVKQAVDDYAEMTGVDLHFGLIDETGILDKFPEWWFRK